MNSSTTDRAPTAGQMPKWIRSIDQATHGQFLIDAWLALDPNSQDQCLAQLIAATVHEGPGTALERFASTGVLNAQAALTELNEIEVPMEREPWLDALGRHIIAAGKRS